MSNSVTRTQNVLVRMKTMDMGNENCKDGDENVHRASVLSLHKFPYQKRTCILIYSGPGVSNSCLQHTCAMLGEYLHPLYTLHCIEQPSSLSDPAIHWEQWTGLFVLPGGRDLPFVQDLLQQRTSDKHQSCITRLTKYIQYDQGNFIGICAGAYFASNDILFEKNRDDYEISGSRWGLCSDITAIGTLYPFTPRYEYNSELGASALLMEAKVPEIDASIEAFFSYYNGGCYFIVNSSPNAHVEPYQSEIVAICTLDEKDNLDLSLPTRDIFPHRRLPMMIYKNFEGQGGGKAFYLVFTLSLILIL